MTSGSSMQAIILTRPPQLLQISMSTLGPRGAIAQECLCMTMRYQGIDAEPALTLDEQPHAIGEPHRGSLETLRYWNRLAAVATRTPDSSTQS